MKLFLLLSFQAAAAPAPAPAPSAKVDAIDFDLARVKPPDPCGAGGEGSEIVVCGRRKPPPYPLDRMAKIYEPRPLRAEIGLGGGATADVHADEAAMSNGQLSKRVMVGIKVPF